MTVCRRCASELRAAAKFCSECGESTQPTDAAEFKQVTVLFADVVRSMDIAVAIGPERLRGIMSEVFDVSAAAVKRYGGTVDKFTGDGIMAVFGAPVALEDHALRGCLAALHLQREIRRLAVRFGREGVDVSVRVGLNSGQVVAGKLGAGSLAYTSIGEAVGMAQRMESVAPVGGVAISESTARLVDEVVDLSEPDFLVVKGSATAVAVRRLLHVRPHHALSRRADSPLIGRRWEMAVLEGTFEEVLDGCGGTSVGLCGPAGIGKSRVVREMAAMAATRGVQVFGARCDSIAKEVPFHVVAQLLRAVLKVGDVESPSDRARLAQVLPDVGAEDLLLLGDLLGIDDPDVAMPTLHPDARRRRLTALIRGAWTTQRSPAVFVVEDAQWIDEISESMLADFTAVLSRTDSMALITHRPDYRGPLSQLAEGRTITLAPLSDAETSELIAEQMGTHQSLTGLASTIGERAVGNPFFVKEIVRDLVERGVLHGRRGAYTSTATAAEVSVPPTLYAVIAARIDRLDDRAKRTLNAAAVVGTRCTADLLETIGVVPAFDALVEAEMVDQVKSSSSDEYVFRQPLIRTVAYETLLLAERAEVHRRVAAAIETAEPTLAEQNAALIGEHLEAAGDFGAAYGWHMRAGAWSRNRDIAAARLSWARARHVAYALPADDPGRLAMRIAAGTLLCATAYRTAESMSDSGFHEVRELAAAAGDKRSLTLAMLGQYTDHMVHGSVTEASALGTEVWSLLEGIGDPVLTVGLSVAPMVSKQETGDVDELLRWSQTAIELADGDPTMGDVVFGSPLALALTFRGIARCWLGLANWRNDFRDSLTMARGADRLTFSKCVVYQHSVRTLQGVLLPDDSTLREAEEALTIAVDHGDHHAVALATYCLGGLLLERGSAERRRGRHLLAKIREMSDRGHFYRSELAVLDLFHARELARDGHLDVAVDELRAAGNRVSERGQFAHGVVATRFLVEALLQRHGRGDVQEADAAIERLASAGRDDLAIVEVVLLGLRARVARARGDDVTYRVSLRRCRERATALGFEGCVATAQLR
ncbi:AAA family ATPase [Mycobacterium yunnanensis]|uniref:AAA family ATPase n=1 Tax=Mycobacterium yunnanensis TaxID=368477 RepID=A0A9X3BR53_9MYCO|nr:adenylate/guanylate cyclase domain-containing protein [Mycobacterium yunnanensis]MCV7419164.1 AAA family ATPase [Mycobacterium yunnanensis]